MTKKHFEAFAQRVAADIQTAKDGFGLLPADEVIAESYKEGWIAAQRRCARTFADIAAQDNPRFDRTRFLKACGLE